MQRCMSVWLRLPALNVFDSLKELNSERDRRLIRRCWGLLTEFETQPLIRRRPSLAN
jgi:hypothetical protein